MNYGCFTTSAEGLINLSEKLGTAISKLAASISGIEHDANRIINACNKLDSYNGKGSKGYPVAVKGGDGSTNYYEMVWEITGQDGTRERVNRALDELNEVKVSLQEQFQKVSKMVANIGEEIASDEDAIEALLGNIAYNKYDAAGHNFISKDKFANTKQYWTDGKLEFADNINGQSLGKDVRVIIKNGVYMGFTTVAAMNAYNNAKSGSSGTAGGPYTASPRIVTNKDIKTKAEEKADVYRSIKENQASSHDRSATTTTKPSSKKSAKAGKYQGTNSVEGDKDKDSTNRSNENAYTRTTSNNATTTTGKSITTGTKAVEKEGSTKIYNITDSTVKKAKAAGRELESLNGSNQYIGGVEVRESGYRDENGDFVTIIDKNGTIYAWRKKELSGPRWIKNNDFKSAKELDKLYMKGKTFGDDDIFK